jgi:hypothetical protein
MNLRNISDIISRQPTTEFIISLVPILIEDNFTNLTKNETLVINTTKSSFRRTSTVYQENNYYLVGVFGGLFGVAALFIILIIYIKQLEKKNKDLFERFERLPMYSNISKV